MLLYIYIYMVDGWMDGYGWMDMDGWMDGHIHIPFCNEVVTFFHLVVAFCNLVVAFVT